jgi:Holliday junction DNA helicase RuvA
MVVIARLAGRLVRKSPQELVVDVHGVGFKVLVSLSAFAALPAEGEAVVLAIHTQVRENAIELFGFLAGDEKQLFTELIGVSGIGPRMALTILSGMPALELARALSGGDVARLVSVPGVGKRTAERLVVELQDKARSIIGDAGAEKSVVRADDEAVSALVNLGYRRADAEKAVRRAMQAGESELAGVIRAALRQLSG